MIPERERLLQLARLIGHDAFSERFGSPQTAQPDGGELHALLDERIDEVTAHLVEEAAASDDVLDAASALSYLDDRLRVLGDLLSDEQGQRVRAAFKEKTAAW